MYEQVLIGSGAAALAFGLIQLMPYGHDHSLPKVNDERQWPDATTHDLAKRACFDCHCNQLLLDATHNVFCFANRVDHRENICSQGK